MKPIPYPADTSAKGWRFELDYERIEQSGTWSAAMAAALDGLPLARPLLLAMWYAAWKQVPCGSLPSDEVELAGAIGLPSAVFAQYRSVLMRGWWQAEDGRLYHDTMAERVLEMMGRRRSESDRKARQRAGTQPPDQACPAVVPRDTAGTTAGLHPESDTDHRLPTKEEKGGQAPLKPPARKRAAVDRPPDWRPPDWVPAETWGQFVAHRKAMRGVPFTDAARDGVVRDLGRLRDAGHDPGDMLTTAIVRGWRTVFEPRAGQRAPPRSASDAERAAANAQANAEAKRLLGIGSKTPPVEIIDA